MFDDFTAYYHENVVAAFIAYRKLSTDGLAGRSRDLREALVAATALFHLREHLPEANAISRADVEKQCADYALLGDVVNATKHKTITQTTPHGAPLVAQADKLTEKLLIIEYEDDEGVYSCTQKLVVVALVDGRERDLLEVLTNVINYWEYYLCSFGALPKLREFVFENPIRYRTREECLDIGLNFEVIRGQRFKQTMQLLRFDTTSGTGKPIDLSGSQVKFSIYKPRFDFEISLKDDASGKVYTKTVVLSDEDNAALASMADDEERQAYAASLSVTQVALQELAAEVNFNGLEMAKE